MCLCGGFLGTLWINLTKGGELRWTLAIGNCLGAFLLYQTLTQIGPPLKYTYIFFGCFRIGIINQPPSYFHNQKQQISPPPILFTTNRCVHNPIFKRKFRASLVPASVSCQSLRITSTVSMQVRSMTYMDICNCILISFVSVCAVFVFCVAPPLPPVLAARRGRTLLGAEGSNAGKTPEIIFKKL